MLNPRELEEDLWAPDRTDAQRRELWRDKYAGKQVSWSGSVHSIEDRCDPARWRKIELSAFVTSLRLGDDAITGLSVFASAPRSRLEEFAKFSKGSTVILSGTLAPDWRGIASGHNIHMVDASLAPPGQPASALPAPSRHRSAIGFTIALLILSVISIFLGLSMRNVALDVLAVACWAAAGILQWLITFRR